MESFIYKGVKFEASNIDTTSKDIAWFSQRYGHGDLDILLADGKYCLPFKECLKGFNPNKRDYFKLYSLMIVKKIVIKKLVKSKNEKFDNLINWFVPIKRARLVYRCFGIIICGV